MGLGIPGVFLEKPNTQTIPHHPHVFLLRIDQEISMIFFLIVRSRGGKGMRSTTLVYPPPMNEKRG